jgi:XTP/dITP diphosphohydrolase
MPTASHSSLTPIASPRDLVIGTHNRKKGAELAELLAPYGYTVVTLADVRGAIEVVEDGDSFAANAALKASQQARHLGRWVLADDSGLEVDALGGAPGIYSARFAEAAVKQSDEARMTNDERRSTLVSTDEANNQHLLSQLADMPLERRTARYVCHVTLADPAGAIRAESEEYCRGRIRFDASGVNGFGYDPLFEVVEYHRTFGELGPRVKRAISHRARALRAILPQLLRVLGNGPSALH